MFHSDFDSDFYLDWAQTFWVVQYFLMEASDKLCNKDEDNVF